MPSPFGPMQDMTPLMFMQDGIYVSGELWNYWRDLFSQPLVCKMWAFVMDDIDDEHACLARASLTCLGFDFEIFALCQAFAPL